MMSEFNKIGDIIPNLKKWIPPEEQEKFCPYCKSRMIATKGYYTFMNEKRYNYNYDCPNKCEEKIKMRSEYSKRYRKAKRVWEEVGFSRLCVGWTLKKMTCENIGYLRQYAETFNKSSKALVLKGYKGTGKSLASECIAKVIVKKGRTVKITNMTEVNMKINQAQRKDEYEKFCNDLLKLDLIIIDDFGREQYNTEKSLENVFQFFNLLTRYKKPYIVSVNPEMLALIAEKPQLDAVLDRFRQSELVKILEFKKGSFRK